MKEGKRERERERKWGKEESSSAEVSLEMDSWHPRRGIREHSSSIQQRPWFPHPDSESNLASTFPIIPSFTSYLRVLVFIFIWGERREVLSVWLLLRQFLEYSTNVASGMDRVRESMPLLSKCTLAVRMVHFFPLFFTSDILTSASSSQTGKEKK